MKANFFKNQWFILLEKVVFAYEIKPGKKKALIN